MVRLTKEEAEVVIGLINSFQQDGAEWTFENIKLNDLKRKCHEEKKEVRVC